MTIIKEHFGKGLINFYLIIKKIVTEHKIGHTFRPEPDIYIYIYAKDLKRD